MAPYREPGPLLPENILIVAPCIYNKQSRSFTAAELLYRIIFCKGQLVHKSNCMTYSKLSQSKQICSNRESIIACM
uniref:Uncharacterized protein n=1 Tax=Anguilla anguilla TaxID=7936 RepID=A0A0E9XNB2_ANGAN